MDVDQVVKEIREIVARAQAKEEQLPRDFQQLAMLVLQLDGWLCMKGTLPTTWQRPHPDDLLMP